MHTPSQEVALQSELAALESEIARVRMKLAEKHGVTVEALPSHAGKEALREVIGGRIYSGERAQPAPPVQASPTPTPVVAATQTTTDGSYLDVLSENEVDQVNDLIARVGAEGIAKTIERAKETAPFILDAFHDALVDRLYDELKARNIIK